MHDRAMNKKTSEFQDTYLLSLQGMTLSHLARRRKSSTLNQSNNFLCALLTLNPESKANVCSKGENSIIFITLFTPADVLIAWYLSKLQSSWFLCREDTCKSIKFHRILPDHFCYIFLLFIWPDYISTLELLDIDSTS